MEHGLYTAYLGMRARQQALDATANNLANASSPGFKADLPTFQAVAATVAAADPTDSRPTVLRQPVDADLRLGPVHVREASLVAGTVSRFQAGLLRQTDRPLDIALQGDSFLTVQTVRGERYTRAGALACDSHGQLVTSQGDLVIGEQGPITLPQGNITFGEHGEVMINGQMTNRLKLVRFDNPQTALLKEGASLFQAVDPVGQPPQLTPAARILSGTLEQSNVDPVQEMAAMIRNSREFDALQRSMTTLTNDLGRKVVNELGRL